jgi:hypothetical protein
MISIPYGIEVIENNAFENCSLSRITFKSLFSWFGAKRNLKELKREVFVGSRLESIVIPSTVQVIRERCFYECECLREIIFSRGSNLVRIECSAFSRSGLRSVRIPESVEIIESFCFYECEYLSEILFEAGSELSEVGFQAFGKTGLETVSVPMLSVDDSVNESASDASRPYSSSMSRKKDWKWMRDHEDKPTVMIVSRRRESDCEKKIVEKRKKKTCWCCSTCRRIDAK